MPLKFFTKKILYSAAVAVLCAAVGGFLCHFTAQPVKNAFATVYFIDRGVSGSEVRTDTDIAKSVSELRSCVKSVEMLENVSAFADIPILELSEALTVERLNHADGAEIALSGLEDPSDAPIILGTVMNLLQKSDTAPELNIISLCDISRQPMFPYAAVCIAAGGFAGVICYIGMSLSKSGRKSYIIAKEKEKESENSDVSFTVQNYPLLAVSCAADLGSVDYSAPDGLEKSGYISAAHSLLHDLQGDGCKIIAVSPAHSFRPMEIPSDAKFTAYLSCALAETGARTAVIECDLKEPCINKLFGKSGVGGIADIAAGNCTIWDAVVSNARKGVDIIAEKSSYPAPAAVFTSSAFAQLISYISTQYDVILLRAPKAWDCEEWELISRCCTGMIAVTENGNLPDDRCAEGMLKSKNMFVGICSVKNAADDKEG